MPREIIALTDLMRRSREADERASYNQAQESRAQEQHERAGAEHEARMRKYDLESQRMENEEAYLELARPLTAAFQEAQTRQAQIEANTARWRAQREEAVNNFRRFQVAWGAGQEDEAWAIAEDFYNGHIFDSQVVKKGPNGTRLIENSETGEAHPLNLNLEQVAEAWTGYLAANPADFYRARKDEELQRYNANLMAPLEAMHNPDSWYLDNAGNRVMRATKVDVQTGEKSVFFINDSGQQIFHSAEELGKAGFKPMTTQEPLLQQDLYRLQQQIKNTTDPKVKAALEAQLEQAQGALEFAEAVRGLSNALDSRELAQVDSVIKSRWASMPEEQQFQYGSFEAFEATVKPNLVEETRQEKANARFSHRYGKPAANQTAAAPQDPGGADWRAWLGGAESTPPARQDDMLAASHASPPPGQPHPRQNLRDMPTSGQPIHAGDVTIDPNAPGLTLPRAIREYRPGQGVDPTLAEIMRDRGAPSTQADPRRTPNPWTLQEYMNHGM